MSNLKNTMNDEIDILFAGNVRGAARLEQRGSEVVATAQVCATLLSVHDGRVIRHPCCLTVELAGMHAHAFARQHGAGSRVVLRGYLEERCTMGTERLPRADGPGVAEVQVERRHYVLIIERVLHSAPPAAAPIAQKAPLASEDQTPPAVEDRTPPTDPLPADPTSWSF
jgi:hypothetical protein